MRLSTLDEIAAAALVERRRMRQAAEEGLCGLRRSHESALGRWAFAWHLQAQDVLAEGRTLPARDLYEHMKQIEGE